MKKSLLSLCAALLLIPFVSFAKPLAFAEMFGDGMVLQRGMPVRVWGGAKEKTAVKVETDGVSATATADASGDWNLQLPELKTGGPYVLTLSSGGKQVVLKDVYVGEVWLASGQSNMAFSLQGCVDGRAEVGRASNRNIRLAYVPKRLFESDTADGGPAPIVWQTATAEYVSKMSGVAYYFACKLQAGLDVPVGIINCAIGGSSAESWMRRESLLKNPVTAPLEENYVKYLASKSEEELKADYDAWQEKRAEYLKTRKGVNPRAPFHLSQTRPGGMCEYMLGRVIPFTVRGVIWYQGENNSSRAWQYRTLFPMMIADWRAMFRSPDIFFCFAQLPGYGGAGPGVWPEMRDAQAYTAKTVPHTAMAVTIDVGERNDIHPKNKKPVGERMGMLVLNDVYGKPQPQGPKFVSASAKGNKMVVTIDAGAGKLTTTDGAAPACFAVAGKDMKFVPAEARLTGGDKVEVWAKGVDAPVAVRYAWENWQVVNLYNEAGLPVPPLRTDELPMASEKKLF